MLFPYTLTPEARWFFQQYSLDLICLTALIINSVFLFSIYKQLKKIIPKGRLIHFIYQSIATTDVQVGQAIQQLEQMNKTQEDILIKLNQLKENQLKSPGRAITQTGFQKPTDMAYVNAIKDIQAGISIDEVALRYELSRDELEILCAVYAPSAKKNISEYSFHSEV